MYIQPGIMMKPPTGFEWDAAQDERCLAEYGFSFADVVYVFLAPDFDYLRIGPRNVDGEQRYLAIGALPWGLVVPVVYTMRTGVRRLIWVRPARREERAAFKEHNGP